MSSPKSRHSVDERSPCCNLRYCLIVWAILRLAVSIFWAFIMSRAAVITISFYADNKSLFNGRLLDMLLFQIPAIFVQLVEFAMLITFIMAGLKKRADLYTHYYRYNIVFVVIYIACVASYLLLGYYYGHYLVGIYLTYHFGNLAAMMGIKIHYDTVIFLIIAGIDVCLEILVICLVKKLIKRYKNNDDDCETV